MQLLLSLPFCLVFVKGNLICFSFVIFHCKLPLLCFASLLPSPAFPSLPASFSLSCSAPWSSSHLGIAKPSSCSFESVSHSYGFKAHVYVEEVGCWVPSEQTVLQNPATFILQTRNLPKTTFCEETQNDTYNTYYVSQFHLSFLIQQISVQNQ